MARTTATNGRRGRLPAGERDARHQAVLDAALAELVDNGPESMTMLAVARRAGASKETLYSWFGNREGLLRALIERNADLSAQRVQAALDTAFDTGFGTAFGTGSDPALGPVHDPGTRRPVDPIDTLTGYVRGLLGLLLGPASLALNRAAMSDPELARLLLTSGRHRIGPLVERYLERLDDAGLLRLTVDPREAFTLLYGLAIQDLQIRALLGESPPGDDELTHRAAVAVQRFVRLATQPDGAQGSQTQPR